MAAFVLTVQIVKKDAQALVLVQKIAPLDADVMKVSANLALTLIAPNVLISQDVSVLMAHAWMILALILLVSVYLVTE